MIGILNNHIEWWNFCSTAHAMKLPHALLFKLYSKLSSLLYNVLTLQFYFFQMDTQLFLTSFEHKSLTAISRWNADGYKLNLLNNSNTATCCWIVANTASVLGFWIIMDSGYGPLFLASDKHIKVGSRFLATLYTSLFHL